MMPLDKKVNCGGRAAKVGLQVNDEIIGVNNLDIEKHPLTLGSALNSENLIIGQLLPTLVSCLFLPRMQSHHLCSCLLLSYDVHVFSCILVFSLLDSHSDTFRRQHRRPSCLSSLCLSCIVADCR